jgi:hypothetical protein
MDCGGLSPTRGAERGAKRLEGTTQPRLRRAERDAERVGERRQGHPDVVVEDQDGTMIRAEGSEGAFELVAVRDLADLVDHEDRHHRWQFDLDRSPSPSSDGVETGIDGQPVKPGVEPIGFAQAREVAPGSDVRVLDRVASQLPVAEDEASDRLQTRDRALDEQREGVMVASACPLDETPLIHGCPSLSPVRCTEHYGVHVVRTIPGLDPRTPVGS